MRFSLCRQARPDALAWKPRLRATRAIQILAIFRGYWRGMLTIDGQTIIYRQQQLPLPLRLFMLVLGLSLAIGLPLPFLVYPDWSTPDPILLIAVIAIVVGLGMGGFLTAAALWSASELRLDPATGRADRTLRGPLVNRHESFPLSALTLSDVILRDFGRRPLPAPPPVAPPRLPARHHLFPEPRRGRALAAQDRGHSRRLTAPLANRPRSAYMPRREVGAGRHLANPVRSGRKQP